MIWTNAFNLKILRKLENCDVIAISRKQKHLDVAKKLGASSTITFDQDLEKFLEELKNKVGLLDETFFMYGEDIDLSYRIKQGGYENYYFADTTIIHYKGESTKKSSVNYVIVFYSVL